MNRNNSDVYDGLLTSAKDFCSITVAKIITIQRWLINISVRESPHISSSIARLVRRWLVDANDKITEAYWQDMGMAGLASVWAMARRRPICRIRA